jgi:peptidoglycan/LPS O-acetylase OafA/YrhL
VRLLADRGFDTLFSLPVKAAGMELDGETVRQILVAGLAVVAFVVALFFIGQTYGTNGGSTISATGGVALVGLLGGFIVVMAIVGLWLERQDFDS